MVEEGDLPDTIPEIMTVLADVFVEAMVGTMPPDAGAGMLLTLGAMLYHQFPRFGEAVVRDIAEDSAPGMGFTPQEFLEDWSANVAPLIPVHLR